MPDAGRAFAAQDCQPDVARRLPKPLAWVRTPDPHATVDRLFTSQHVKDLQLIIAAALFGVLLVFFIGLTLSFGITAGPEAAWSIQLVLTDLRTFLTFFAPVLAVFGAVLTWAYQVGSARLGVVDLFACEISTLCRVATLVGTVRRFVDRFNQGPLSETADASGPLTPVAHPFTSQENYFPVFESNTRDLQTLEAKVVINITAFYTFMKAVRDSLRTLAEIRPQTADVDSPSKARASESWHARARDVVYLLFLALESARLAITDLVEFEPEKAERTIVVLLSELEAYRFLRSQFKDENDVYHKRIMLRVFDYQLLVPKLCRCVETGRALEKQKSGKESEKPGLWEPAWVLLPELNRRYQEAGVEQSMIDA